MQPVIETGQSTTQVRQTNASLAFQILFGLAHIVLGFLLVTVNLVLLPVQVTMMVEPAQRITIFSMLVGVGAVSSILATPIVGALSDRWGKQRRPLLLFCVFLAALSFFLLATASSVLQLSVGAVLAMAAAGGILAVLTALLPERFLVQHRAVGAALAGMGPLVGNAIGGILVAHTPSIQMSYMLLGSLLVGFILLFTLLLKEKPAEPHQSQKRRALKFTSFWISPRAYPDFGWTWLSRLFIFFAWTTLNNYILFYLYDVVHFSVQQGTQGAQIFFAVSTLFLLLGSLIIGMFSDLLQRRRVFVTISCILLGGGLLLLAFTTEWAIVSMLAGLIGLGMGGYLSSDLALATQVLPAAESRGKDLGIMNTAIFLPMVFSPLFAGALLNISHSYTILFALLAGASLAAVVCILQVRAVR